MKSTPKTKAKSPTPRKAGRPTDSAGVAQRSDTILAVAIQVFAQRGFAATDVQEIADKAGVGKGTIYRHFTNKEGLFLAAAESGVQQLKAALDERMQHEQHTLDRLRTALLTALEFFDKHPELVELIIQERAHFRDRQAPTFFEHKSGEDKEKWKQMFRELMRQGVVRKLPVDQILDTLSQFLWGAIFVNYFAGRKKPLARQAEEINAIIYHGILVPPSEQ